LRFYRDNPTLIETKTKSSTKPIKMHNKSVFGTHLQTCKILKIPLNKPKKQRNKKVDAIYIKAVD